MEIIDIILGLVLLLGLYKGAKNGLLIELASLAALILGLYGAMHFSYIVGDFLHQKMDWSESHMGLISFIITFIIIVILVNLLGKFLTKVAQMVLLGFLNRLAGAVFGVLKIAVIIGALLIFADRAGFSAGLLSDTAKERSVLYMPIKELGAFVFDRVLEEAPEFMDDPDTNITV